MYTFPVMENSTKNETEEHTKGKKMHARNPRIVQQKGKEFS